MCLGDILASGLSGIVRLLPFPPWSRDLVLGLGKSWEDGDREWGQEQGYRRGLASLQAVLHLGEEGQESKEGESVWAPGRLPGVCKGKLGTLTVGLA